MAFTLFENRTFAISLQNRNDRQQRCADEFQRVGWPVEFYRPVKDPEGGVKGCYCSHQHLARIGLERNLDWMVNFEDDPRFREKRLKLDVLRQFLATVTDWDVLYLGHDPSKMQSTSIKGIARCRSLCTHAYILSRRGMEKLAAREWDGTPSDVLFRDQFTCYALHPMIVHQRQDGTSDVNTTMAPKLRIPYNLIHDVRAQVLMLTSSCTPRTSGKRF